MVTKIRDDILKSLRDLAPAREKRIQLLDSISSDIRIVENELAKGGLPRFSYRILQDGYIWHLEWEPRKGRIFLQTESDCRPLGNYPGDYRIIIYEYLPAFIEKITQRIEN